jgi:hypothetical protein
MRSSQALLSSNEVIFVTVAPSQGSLPFRDLLDEYGLLLDIHPCVFLPVLEI